MLAFLMTQLAPICTFTQADLAFKHTVDIDRHILATAQNTTHIQSSRVGQTHALLHQLERQTLLVSTLQLSQLHRAVDPGDLHRVIDLVRHYRHTIGYGHFDDVGQVKLALGVFVVQPDSQVLSWRAGAAMMPL